MIELLKPFCEPQHESHPCFHPGEDSSAEVSPHRRQKRGGAVGLHEKFNDSESAEFLFGMRSRGDDNHRHRRQLGIELPPGPEKLLAAHDRKPQIEKDERRPPSDLPIFDRDGRILEAHRINPCRAEQFENQSAKVVVVLDDHDRAVQSHAPMLGPTTYAPGELTLS